MPTYEELVLNARKKQNKLGVRVQGEIIKTYVEASKILSKRIEEYRPLGFNTMYFESLQGDIDKTIAALEGRLKETVNKGISGTVGIISETQQEFNNMVFPKDVAEMANSYIRMNNYRYVANVISGKLYKDSLPLNSRIWLITEKNKNDIGNLITTNIAKGANSRELAQLVEGYVNPLVATKAKTLVSGMGVNVAYQAQRLARTSITHASIETQREVAKENSFCNGLKWNLSSSHFERQVSRWGEDICDTYANQDNYNLGRGIFPINDYPISHPNCLCHATQAQPPLEDIIKRVNSWVDGEKDKELDKNFKKWKKAKEENEKATPKATKKPKKATKKPKTEKAQKEQTTTQQIMTKDCLPQIFNEKRHKKTSEILINTINSSENPNKDVALLFSKIQELQNRSNFELKTIKHAGSEGYYFGVSGRKLTLNIPNLSKTADNLEDIGTVIHECTHYLDFLLKEKYEYASNHFSPLREAVSVAWDDAIAGPKMDALLKKHDKMYMQLFDVYSDKYDKGYDKLLKEEGKSWTTWDEFEKLNNKLFKKLEKEREKVQGNLLGGGLGAMEDIYDALNYGSRPYISGHGAEYYSTSENRCAEVFAQYTTLSLTRPDLIELLREDKPQLVGALEGFVKDLLKNI